MRKSGLVFAAIVFLFFSASFAQTLNVALHPYIPRTVQFKQALTRNWDELHTGVKLNFVDFNFYKEDPSPQIDVFVFDVFFLEDYKAKNYLMPLPKELVHDTTDFLPYAWQGCQSNHVVYGIPYLGCQYIYIYRSDDKELDQELNLHQLHKIIGNAKNPLLLKPAYNEGLLIDMSEPVARSFFYFNAVMHNQNASVANPPMPEPDDLDREAVRNLRTLARMGGFKQAGDSTIFQDRIKWFQEGYGRALVGWTEMLESFPPDKLGNYKFRIIPLTNTHHDKYAYPLDIAAVSSTVDSSKRELAIMLVNLMGSTKVLYESMRSDQKNPNPQFLIPVRKSLMGKLQADHPVYTDIYQMMYKYPAYPFQLGAGSKRWISQSRKNLEQEIFK